jgi:hypothetical protein
MQRMYTVLALAERAHRGSDRDRALARIDAIADATLATYERDGPHRFLLPYARARPFRYEKDRSVFVEGEIALVLAVRALLSNAPPEPRLRTLTARIAEQLRAGPALSGESYPDECWTFCNTVALAALRIADRSLGTDHRPLAERWVAYAKAHLVDAETGLLVSSYTWDGRVLDGPEGSTIFMAAHNLRLVDAAFARDQYDRARALLGRDVLGFGYAREWPTFTVGRSDIDSGPVIPLLGASPGASGLALLGAGSFDDETAFRAFERSLELMGFPIVDETGRRYAAAGPMGDAVIFYAYEVGSLWTELGRTPDAV